MRHCVLENHLLCSVLKGLYYPNQYIFLTETIQIIDAFSLGCCNCQVVIT
jgi:hypothetical protein